MGKEPELEEVGSPRNTEGDDMKSSILTVREVIDTFNLENRSGGTPYEGVPWDLAESDVTLEQQIIQFVYENPGRSYSAIFRYLKEQGHAYTEILEAYNILMYDKKVLRRLNVGTSASPRYAHFVTQYFFAEPRRDALYDILGPI